MSRRDGGGAKKDHDRLSNKTISDPSLQKKDFDQSNLWQSILSDVA
jgi:hypothetical protein